MKRALLIKMSSLGDVVHALPAVTEAAASGWRFDWVVEEAFADIPARHPAVDRVLPIAWRRWRRQLWRQRGELATFRRALRAERYDVVIDSQGLIKSAAVRAMASADQSLGFDRASAREGLSSLGLSRAYTVPRGQHAIDRQRQLFRQALCIEGEEALDFGLEAPTASEGPPLCVLLHGTTWASKHLPEAQWAGLINLAADAGWRVALTWGSEDERLRAERLAAAGTTEIWPKQDLSALATRLAAAQLVIGVDSGLSHLAAALSVPTVGLYGSTDAVLTGVRGRHALALAAEFGCAPCLRRDCNFDGAVPRNELGLIHPPCYATLPPETVWRHAMDLVHAHRLQHL